MGVFRKNDERGTESSVHDPFAVLDVSALLSKQLSTPMAERLGAENPNGREFFVTLLGHRLFCEALQVLPHLLSPTVSIAWGTTCCWYGFLPDPPPQKRRSLAALMQWLEDPKSLPEDELLRYSREEGYSPVGWLLKAALQIPSPEASESRAQRERRDAQCREMVACGVLLMTIWGEPRISTCRCERFLEFGSERLRHNAVRLTEVPTRVRISYDTQKKKVFDERLLMKMPTRDQVLDFLKTKKEVLRACISEENRAEDWDGESANAESSVEAF